MNMRSEEVARIEWGGEEERDGSAAAAADSRVGSVGGGWWWALLGLIRDAHEQNVFQHTQAIRR